MNSIITTLSLAGFIAVGVGAALGAWLRWMFALIFNGFFPLLPFGTLLANVCGGLLAGIAVGYFAQHEHLPPVWHLFIITGFLGGFTTFSTFSAEAVLLLQRGDYWWALAHSSAHLLGSILMCLVGYVLYRWAA